MALVMVIPEAARADAPRTCGSATVAPSGPWISERLETNTDVDWFAFEVAEQTFTIVTLGKAPGPVSLELYSSCATRLARSDRGGSRFEEVVMDLPAGTYRVRVAAEGPVNHTATYSLRFRPLAHDMVVLSATSWVTSSKYLVIVGEVFNNTSEPQIGNASATYYDANGTKIGEDAAGLYVDHVGIGKRSAFSVSAPKPAGYDHYSLSIDHWAGAAPMGGLTIIKGKPYVDALDCRNYPGSIRNDNSFSVQFVLPSMTLYGVKGTVVDADWTYTDPHTIAPGGTSPFRMWSCRYEKAQTTAFVVDGDQV